MPANSCSPVNTTLDIIGGKWKPAIVYHLMQQTQRFNALRRLLPEASQRMLTLQLRELEAAGIVWRKDYGEQPPRVEYSLTEFGRTLLPVVQAMYDWGDTYAAECARIRQKAV